MGRIFDIVSARRKALASSIICLALSLGPSAWAQSPAATSYDVVIEGGQVMDPETGFDRIANIGIVGGTVQTVTDEKLRGKRKIDARGMVVAPGFIDLHAHGQTPSDNDIQVRDGVTTALELEQGVYPVAPFYSRREGRSRINFGTAVSHRGMRIYVATGMNTTDSFDDLDHAARILATQDKWAYPRFDEQQVSRMREMFRADHAIGGLGLGMAPEYFPGAGRDEVLALFQEAADLNSVIFVHARASETAEGDGPMAPIQEMIANVAATGASLHIVHIGSKALGAIDPVMQMIVGARAQGLDVSTEVYPYTAGSTRIGSALYDDGWQKRRSGQYSDIEWPPTGERLTEESFKRYRKESPQTFVVFHNIPERTVDTAIAHPIVMIASDGIPFVNGAGHPRGAGTFARVLGHYVRERKLISLMDGLRKMTLMPAQRLEAIAPVMRKKGRLQVGSAADITIFDPARIIDRATFAKPTMPSDGIPFVLVGGVVVVDKGQIVSDALPGKAIKSAVADTR